MTVSGITNISGTFGPTTYVYNDFVLYGRSTLSNLATTATNMGAGDVGSLVYQSKILKRLYFVFVAVFPVV